MHQIIYTDSSNTFSIGHDSKDNYTPWALSTENCVSGFHTMEAAVYGAYERGFISKRDIAKVQAAIQKEIIRQATH